MPHGGRLTIETANLRMDDRMAAEYQLSTGRYVSLSVTDTGTGMNGALVQRIFEPFFTTKPMGLGTGLGLSMVYGFAVQSGGQVQAHSEVGVGTTMCLYLPQHDGDAVDMAVENSVPSEPGAPESGTVLVVDDEAHVRAIVSEALTDMGFATVEAEDGAKGLALLRSDRAIDLLVTDVGLPGGMNGRQLADAGRELHPAMKVPTKPFDLDTLAARVTDLLA